MPVVMVEKTAHHCLFCSIDSDGPGDPCKRHERVEQRVHTKPTTNRCCCVRGRVLQKEKTLPVLLNTPHGSQRCDGHAVSFLEELDATTVACRLVLIGYLG